MVKLWEAVKRAIWCRHNWVFIRTVKDQNLRAGYAHWSNTYRCSKCGRMRTEELTDDPGPP